MTARWMTTPSEVDVETNVPYYIFSLVAVTPRRFHFEQIGFLSFLLIHLARPSGDPKILGTARLARAAHWLDSVKKRCVVTLTRNLREATQAPRAKMEMRHPH